MLSRKPVTPSRKIEPRQAVDQPRQRHLLDPGADHRDGVAGRVEPEARLGQRRRQPQVPVGHGVSSCRAGVSIARRREARPPGRGGKVGSGRQAARSARVWQETRNRAVSSAVEHTLHTGGVVGSIPTLPTIHHHAACDFGRRRGGSSACASRRVCQPTCFGRRFEALDVVGLVLGEHLRCAEVGRCGQYRVEYVMH